MHYSHIISISILLCMHANTYTSENAHKAATTNPPAVLQDVLISIHEEQSSSEEDEQLSRAAQATTREQRQFCSDEYVPYIMCATGTCSLCGLGAMALIFRFCL